MSELFFVSELSVSELSGPDFLGVAAPLPLGTEVLGDQRATPNGLHPTDYSVIDVRRLASLGLGIKARGIVGVDRGGSH